jgi:hypothetical protein
VPLPPLLSSRPPGVQILIANVVPCVFGAICGVLLGVSALAYLVLSVLAIAGGDVAGLELRDGVEGATRGVIGGFQFGALILLAHQLEGSSAKADLPDPPVLLLVVTIGFGALLGYLGGRTRERRMRAANPPPVAPPPAA